jgi:hypothetical protein
MTTPLNISSEAARTYHYANGQTFTITAPTELHVITDERGTSHRVVASDGQTYRPERGWLAISWLPVSGGPAFVA